MPAPESSDATAAFCAAVLRGAAALEEPVTSDAVELAGLVFVDVVPSDDPAMLDSVLVVGFAVVVGAFFVTLEATGVDLGADAMALRCATVTVPPVGVLVFEAVPEVGRYRPPPTYIVAISMLLDRDGQCTHGPRRRQAGWSDICVVGENDLEDVGVAIDFTNNKANRVIGQARQIQPAAAQHSREICKACVILDPAV
jgi:hypothetical protein